MKGERFSDFMLRVQARKVPHPFVSDPNVDPEALDCDECGLPSEAPIHVSLCEARP